MQKVRSQHDLPAPILDRRAVGRIGFPLPEPMDRKVCRHRRFCPF
jgi:hypothetical protein